MAEDAVESSEQSNSSGFAQRLVLGLVGVIAVAALVVALLAVSSASSDNSTLKTQLAAANQKIAALENASAASTIQAIHTGLQNEEGNVHHLLICIPEIQQEINGLNVNSSTSNGWLTSAYLTNPTIISTECNSTLNPTTG